MSPTRTLERTYLTDTGGGEGRQDQGLHRGIHGHWQHRQLHHRDAGVAHSTKCCHRVLRYLADTYEQYYRGMCPRVHFNVLHKSPLVHYYYYY